MADTARFEVSNLQMRLESAEKELSRLEAVASIGWKGITKLAEVLEKAAAIDAAKAQLEEELAEAEAEAQRLAKEVEDLELQRALRQEFNGSDGDQDDLDALVAERDEAVKRVGSLRKRLLAYQSDNPDLARRLGIVTPAAQLAMLTKEMWDEVSTIRAEAEAKAAGLQSRFNELLEQLEAVAREFGTLKGCLMLMDEELVSGGFEATQAHLAVNLKLPSMQELEIRLKTAFLDVPTKVNPSYMHRW